jgi:hypothetical protein
MKLASPVYSLKAWRSLGESAVSSMYGVNGSTVFRRWGGTTLLEKTRSPLNPQSEPQQANRGSFASAVASWQNLSVEEKASWNYFQDVRLHRPVMSGYNLYISRFLLSAGNPHITPDGRRCAR